MREKIATSLGLRLIATTILIIALVVIAYSAFAYNRGRGRAAQELRTKGDLLTRHLAYSSRLGVFAENIDMLKSLAEGIVAERDVVLVAIYNADMKPLYLSDKGGLNGQVSAVDDARQAIAASGEQRTGTADSTLVFVQPVMMKQYANPAKSVYFGEQAAELPERTIGYVRVVLSQESLIRQMRSIFTTNALLAFLFISVSSIIVYVWVKKAVKPLETLTEQVKALGKGGPVMEVSAASNDEIGRLTTAFNSMLQERRKAEQALEKVLMDIHDGIGGITTNISMLSEVARQASSQEESGRALKTIAELARDGMAEVRSLMYSLDRSDLNWQTFAAELRNHGLRYLAPHGTEFSMTADIADTSAPPTSYLCLNLFRIYREALINVIKHADARKVSVLLRVDGETLFLHVQDDGKGCPPVKMIGHGRGISNMMNRTREMNGTCTVLGEEGTCVDVQVPLSAKPAGA